MALVYQQRNVLEANLDYKVEGFCSDLIGSSSTREFWQEQCIQNLVIVCTAAILLQCLHYSFVKLDQVNMLIFDEAHHTKKNHPYARIIKDFYASLSASDHRRPRIFGMTASPLDAKTDVTKAAADLESLLHSEIATVVDMDRAFDESSFSKAQDIFVEYGQTMPPFETALWQRINVLVGQNVVFKRLLKFSRDSTAELGRWCADRVWHLCLTAEEALRMEARTEKNFSSSRILRPTAALDAELAAVREVRQTVLNYPLPTVELNFHHVSRKVQVLIETLTNHFSPESDKCIVFVDQRLTAVLLTDLIRQESLGLVGLKPGMLVSF